MTKPGNMPSNRCSTVLYVTGLVGVVPTLVFGALRCDVGFFGSAFTSALCLIGCVLAQWRYNRRVRRYLQLVCSLLALCLVAGCEGHIQSKPSPPANEHSVVVLPEAMEKRVAEIELDIKEITRLEKSQNNINDSTIKTFQELVQRIKWLESGQMDQTRQNSINESSFQETTKEFADVKTRLAALESKRAVNEPRPVLSEELPPPPEAQKCKACGGTGTGGMMTGRWAGYPIPCEACLGSGRQK